MHLKRLFTSGRGLIDVVIVHAIVAFDHSLEVPAGGSLLQEISS
jgi:hypothetical protein